MERAAADREERAKLEWAAENWAAAEAYLFETRQMKEFLMWDFRRKGTSDWILAKLDSALDLTEYPPATSPRTDIFSSSHEAVNDRSSDVGTNNLTARDE
jgi:hypothetical protein